MNEPVVEIATGRIRGESHVNIDNKTFYCFRGIPYAKPPIGLLRFKAPEPPEPWADIRDATKEGSDCIQRFPRFAKTLRGSEDCLTLNVYTSSLPESKHKYGGKPVMVWIHGGSFVTGSGSSEVYGPELLMTEDIVLVAINYRLGILGFFSLEDPTLNVPGNAGLKDMVMALKWVQENISNFSGDSNNVTIFGESAGAAASHYLILSPMTKDLFHKAILQSGCALNVWAKGRNYAQELAKALKLDTTDERKILKVLQQLPVEKLFEAAETIPDLFLANEVRPHGPVVEKNHKGAFLTEDPLDIIKSGKYNHVPIIIGYTTREGMLSEVLQKPNPFKPLNNLERAIPNFLKLQRGSDVSKLVASLIKEFYFGSEEPSIENKDKCYLLDTDNLFVREILLSAKYHSETSSAPVYLYRMSIETTLNMMKTLYGITEPGVCHADDLGYLFKNALTPEIESGSEEETAVKRFVQLWTNFAKYGNPNSFNENSLINVKWPIVSHGKLNYLDIGKNLTAGVNPEDDRMSFWGDIMKVNPVHKL